MSKKYLDTAGLNKLVANILSKFAAKNHKHVKADITDFPNIPTKTSQLTNDSGFTKTKITVVRW